MNTTTLSEIHVNINRGSATEMSNTVNDKDPQYGIYLEHLGNIFLPNEVDELRDDFHKQDILFFERDTSGEIINNIDEISNQVCFYLTTPLVLGIINGVLPNAVWDITKATISSIFKRLIGKKYNKLTSKGPEIEPISFGVDIKLSKDERFIFKFETITSEETLLIALDKILDFTEKQSKHKNIEKHIEYLVQFDEEKMEWNKTNLLDFIQRYIIRKTK